jgi:hypothetical protein
MSSTGVQHTFVRGNQFGKGGARPNSGPVPSLVREACRQGFMDRLPSLFKIIDGELSRNADRIAAMRVLAQVGLPIQPALNVEPPEQDPFTDEQVVTVFLRLGVPLKNWTPGLLRRYQAGMIIGHLPPADLYEPRGSETIHTCAAALAIQNSR